MHQGPNGAGLSRKAIITQIDAEPDAAGHRLRRPLPDPPLGPGRRRSRRRCEALHDVVRAGKVRYLGASSMWAWQFAKALHVADQHGWTRFVSMQDHYNLLNREEEREMLPLCADQGIGVIPWSPLARGRLTRTWDAGDQPLGDRRVRQNALRQSATRPADRRARRPRSPTRAACHGRRSRWPGCSPTGRHRADRRRHQAAPPRRRRRRRGPRAQRRGDRRLEEPYGPTPSRASERGQSAGGAGGGQYIRPR